MDDPTDRDPVLRALGEDLAREDPRLAAMLGATGAVPRRRGSTAMVLLVIAAVLVAAALLLPPTVAVGAMAMLLAVASPLAVCWLCADDPPAPSAH